MNAEKYTNIIIRSGESGKYLAWHLAHSGENSSLREALDWRLLPERKLPASKNEIWSAKLADLVHHGDHFGVLPARRLPIWRWFENESVQRLRFAHISHQRKANIGIGFCQSQGVVEPKKGVIKPLLL